jgi:hypothetical protein
MGKKCPCENTFGGKEGFEGLERKLKQGKPMRLFPTEHDAEMEAKQVPKVWGKKRI